MSAAAPRRLVLLRHGRTAWNHARRVQGHVDVELDEVGHQEARAAAPEVARLRPSLLWSSDLLRARQTASYVAAATGLEPSYDGRLREFHLGERQGLTHDEYAAADAEEFALFRLGHYDAAPGAEPTHEVGERMRAALGDLLAALAPGECGVAVTHGAAARVAVGAVLGWPAGQFRTLRGLGNCGWVEVVEHPAGGLALDAYNRVAAGQGA